MGKPFARPKVVQSKRDVEVNGQVFILIKSIIELSKSRTLQPKLFN